MDRRRALLAASIVNSDGGESEDNKIVNHGTITMSSAINYTLTFEFPTACEYMTVDCIPQCWYLSKGGTQEISYHPGGLGDTIEIYASNNGFDDYSATNEDDTYIYEVTIDV